MTVEPDSYSFCPACVGLFSASRYPSPTACPSCGSSDVRAATGDDHVTVYDNWQQATAQQADPLGMADHIEREWPEHPEAMRKLR